MCKRNRSFSRILLLLLVLVAGSLQAQILYACQKIEKTASVILHNASDIDIHSTDLCSGHEECFNIDCNAISDSSQGLCCEESSVISINQNLQQNIPIPSSTIESDIDPPQTTGTTYDSFFQKKVILTFAVFPSPDFSSQSGSNTYLITQRLRI